MLIYNLNSQLNGEVMLASLMGIFAQKVPTLRSPFELLAIRLVLAATMQNKAPSQKYMYP
jgi:hypothetical protein